MSALAEDELGRIVLPLLADELAADDQIAYFGWDEPRPLLARLRTFVDEDAAATGALRVESFAEHFDRDVPPGPDALVEFWDDATRTAVAAGFRSLRAVADTTPWLRDRNARSTFLRGDHHVDRYCVDQPLDLVCVFDAWQLDQAALEEITCIHAVAHGPSASFHLHATAAADFALTGEIDTFSVPVLDRVLRLLDREPAGDELTIDATRLAFVNHAALLALERHVERVGLDDVVIRTSGSLAARLAPMLDLRRVRVEAVEPAP